MPAESLERSGRVPVSLSVPRSQTWVLPKKNHRDRYAVERESRVC